MLVGSDLKLAPLIYRGKAMKGRKPSGSEIPEKKGSSVSFFVHTKQGPREQHDTMENACLSL